MSETRCPLCDACDTRLFLDDRDRTFDSSNIGSSRRKISHGRILRCADCGFAFQELRRNSAEMAEAYRKMDVEVYESEVAGRQSTASREMRIVQRFTGGRTGRILDVGCASGHFLREALRAGWSVAGVEPCETLCARATESCGRNAEIHCTILEEARSLLNRSTP